MPSWDGVELWGQRPHNARAAAVEPELAIELPAAAVADVQPGQLGRHGIEKLLALNGAIVAPDFVLRDAAADGPRWK